MICPALTVIANGGKDAMAYKIGAPKAAPTLLGLWSELPHLTASLFQCNINSDVFHAWTEQDLLPKLPKDAVIVMDNATFHKRQDTQEMIEKKGFILEYLPPYSPDLNPIEQKWAQAKAIRRRNNCSILELFRNHQF